MSEKYSCPEEGCDRIFRTEKGMELHLEIQHSPRKRVAKVKGKAEKTSEVAYVEVEKKLKTHNKKISKLNRLVKMRHKPCNLKKSENLTKAKVKKLFPDDPEISKNITKKGYISKPLSKWLVDKKYEVIHAKPLKNGWKAFRLKSERLLISWKEGDVKSQFRVTAPIVIRLDWER